MKRLLLLLTAFSVTWGVTALAQIAGTGVTGPSFNRLEPTIAGTFGTGGGGCSNALDFSASCNSQYLVLIFGGF